MAFTPQVCLGCYSLRDKAAASSPTVVLLQSSSTSAAFPQFPGTNCFVTATVGLRYMMVFAREHTTAVIGQDGKLWQVGSIKSKHGQ